MGSRKVNVHLFFKSGGRSTNTTTFFSSSSVQKYAQHVLSSIDRAATLVMNLRYIYNVNLDGHYLDTDWVRKLSSAKITSEVSVITFLLPTFSYIIIRSVTIGDCQGAPSLDFMFYVVLVCTWLMARTGSELRFIPLLALTIPLLIVRMFAVGDFEGAFSFAFHFLCTLDGPTDHCK